MRNIKKIISVLMVIIMVFTSIPLQGFTEHGLLDWISSIAVAFEEDEMDIQQQTQTNNLLFKPVEGINNSIAPINNSLSGEFNRGAARFRVESFIGKFNKSSEEIEDNFEEPVAVNYSVKRNIQIDEHSDSNVDWSYDELTRTLTISGNGAMNDYEASDSFVVNTPWFGVSSAIEKIIIEEGITRIGNFAFALCVNVKEVVLANTLLEIGDYSFAYDVNISKVTFSNSITSIGEAAFMGCWSLDEIIIPESVNSIGSEAFAMCLNAKKLVIPGTLQNVEMDSFSEMVSLKEIVTSFEFPYGAIFLSDMNISAVALESFINYSNSTAFNSDMGMGIVFDDIKYADAYAYGMKCIYKAEMCDSAETIDLGYSYHQAILDILTYSNEYLGTNYSIEDASEDDLEDVIKVAEQHLLNSTYPDYCIVYCSETSAQHLFCKENGIKHRISNSIEDCFCFDLTGKLGENITWSFDFSTKTLTFSGSGDMENIFNSKHEVISEYVEKVEFSENSSITSIADRVFSNMKNLKEVTIPEGVTSIGSYCFYDSGIEIINLPASLTVNDIDDSYSWCMGTTPIKAINVAEGNTTYFSYGGALYLYQTDSFQKTIYGLVKQPEETYDGTFLDDTVCIWPFAFENYKTITEITLPDQVIIFNDSSFYNCSSIETINIGKMLPFTFEDIEYNSEITSHFVAGCNNLQSINVDSDNTYLSSVDGVLYDKDVTTLILRPTGVDEITLPETVVRINESGGLNTGNLMKVTILNPEFSFYGYGYYLPKSIIISGYRGSEAEEYADYYGHDFEYIEDIDVVSITLNTTNAKLVYNQFESANLAGLTYTVLYSDGVSVEKNNGIKVVEFDSSKPGVQYITVQFRNVTAQYQVTVTCPELRVYDYRDVYIYSEKEVLFSVYINTTASLKFIGGFNSYYKDAVINVSVYDETFNLLKQQSCTIDNLFEFTYTYEAEKIYYIGLSSNYNSSLYLGLDCAHSYVENITEATCGENGYKEGYCIYCGRGNWETIYATAQHIDEDNNNVCDVCNIELMCGDNITWHIEENGTLYINGTGDITNSPWNIHGPIIKSINISEGITSICDNAFSDCYELTEIIIPTNVSTIGNYAFRYCHKLTTVIFKEDSKLQTIGERAFYSSALTEITIPTSVTSIGKYAFYYCSELTNITFKEGSKLQTIGERAFYYCSSLAEIAIPASVTSIGTYAFSNCNKLTAVIFKEDSKLQIIGDRAFAHCPSLTEITIPASVTSIGANAFFRCGSLSAIYVETGNAKYSSRDGVLYNGDKTTLIMYPNGKANESFYIPVSITSINPYAFQYCSNLTTVAFEEGSLIKLIGDYAFYNCDSLIDIIIPASVTSIGSYAFADCDKLSTVIFKDGSKLQTIGERAFYYCYSLAEIAIPASVTSIGTYAFAVCDKLSTVIFKDGSKLQTIGERAFYSSALTEITIPASVTSIGTYAFSNCTKLTTVIFEEGIQLKNISEYMFNNCTSLADITIPSSVTKICQYAFNNCDGLPTVTFAENSNLQTIDRFTFNDCDGLIEMIIPSSVITIGVNAFNWCEKFAKIIFENNSKLKSLGGCAFNSCRALTEITIPASVSSIGNEPFIYCYNLATINIEDGSKYFTSIDGSLYNKSVTKLISCSAGKADVVIPETVTQIGDDAFRGDKMKTITFLSPNFSWSSNDAVNSDVVVRCNTGSSAELFANQYNLNIEYLNNVTLSSIEVDKEKSQLKYNQYETFDLSDVKLVVKYSDGSSVTRTSGFTVSGYNTNEIGTQTLQVKFLGLTTSYDITVDYINVSYNSSCYVQHFANKTSYVRYTPTGTGPVIYSSTYATNYDRIVTICDADMNKLYEQVFLSNENISLTYNYEVGKIYYIGVSIKNYNYNYGSFYITMSCAHNYIETVQQAQTCGSNGSSRFDCAVCKNYYTETKLATAQHIDIDGNDKCDACSVSMKSGDNITWYIDENGTLHINGTGNMLTAPWSIHRNIIKSVVISEGVTSICDNAFYNCDLMTSVAIPSTVITIGYQSFYDCDKLEMVAFSENGQLQSIGERAFYDCDNINEITIPNSVSTIGNSAFYDCYNLSEVVLAENSTLQSIGNSTFYNCDELNSFYVPASVITIGQYAFDNCNGLLSIEFAEDSQLQNINYYAFRNCTALAEFTVPARVTNIGEGVFSGCQKLNKVIFEEDSQLLTIGNYVFDNSIIEEITIPANVTSIGTATFSGSYTLKNIFVEKDNKSYLSDNGVLYNKEKTVLIHYPHKKDASVFEIPDGVTEIGTQAFQGHKYISKVIIPESTTLIGTNAFYNCDKLSTVIFAEDCQIQNIGNYAFYDSDALAEITIPLSVSAVNNYAFYSCNSLSKIVFLNPETTIYNSSNTINSSAKIYGYANSTALTYANNFSRNFEQLECSHNNSEEFEEISPDCTNTGLTAGIYCSFCKTWIDGHNEIPALGHNASEEWFVEKEPTCIANGLEVKHCTRCEIKLMQELVCDPSTYPETPHNYGNGQTYSYNFSYPGAEKLILKFSSSTQTESGYDKIYIYNPDGSLYGQYSGTDLASKTIEVIGESFSIKLTTDGSVVRYGFSFDSIIAVGYYDGESTREIPSLGHDIATEWTLESEPTCTVDGSNIRPCSRCDYAEREPIAQLGHNPVSVPISFPQQCDDIDCNFVVKCTRCKELLTDEESSETQRWKLVFDVTNSINSDEESEIAVLYIKDDLSIGQCTQNVINNDIFGDSGEVSLDIDCEGVPFGYIHKFSISNFRNFAYKVTLCSVDEFGNEFAVWAESYDSRNASDHNSFKWFSTQSDHILILDSVVSEPSCCEKGEEKYICSVCGEEKYIETETLPHTYEDTIIPSTCTLNGYTAHTCSVCGDLYKDTVTEALGHDYKSSYIPPETDKDGYTLFECIRCEENYRVLDPAGPVEGLYATGETYKISLSWYKAVEATVTGYEVFRKAPDDEDFIKVKTINSRNTSSFVDKNLIAGYEYSYKVRAMKGDIAGEFCDVVTAIPLTDTTNPRVIKVEATRTVRDIINGVVTFNLNAEDDVGIVKYNFYVKAKDAEEWTFVEEKNGAICSVSFDTRTVEDGIYDFRATAYDAAGNGDEVGLTKQYLIDNTPPTKITGLTAIEIYATKATLSWNNTPQKDVHHFILRRVTHDGDSISYKTISNNITRTGYYLTGLNPNTSYTYSVAGVDEFGNAGEYSDEFTFTTTNDVDAPYVSSLSPAPGRYSCNSVINFRVKGEDDYNIESIVIQESFDGKYWVDIDSRTISNTIKDVNETFNVSLTEIPEGSYYLRAILKDSAGNTSTEDNTASFVEYYIDRTAPAAPLGLIAISKDGYIELKWEDSPEIDRYAYSLYRAENEAGPYTCISSGLTTINHFDRNVSRGKTYYYKVAVSDYCGNISDFSNVVSVKATEDLLEPEIISLKPVSGTTIGSSLKNIGVKAYDNNMLSKIVLEYRLDTDSDYIVLASKSDINSSEDVLNTQLPINGLSDGDKVYVRAYCEDVSGYSSGYTQDYMYVVDRIAPTAKDINVSSTEGRVTVSWKDGRETDIAGFYIYRSKDGGEYQSISSRPYSSTNSYSYSENLSEGSYIYRIDAIDKVGNIDTFYSEPHYVEKVEIKVDDTPKNNIIAKINSVSYCEVDVQEKFSSEASIADNIITEYNWDFGDGTTSTEANPIKSYDEAGIFKITLTIVDNFGNSSTVQKSVTVKEREMLGTVRIRVCDNNGSPISGIPVFFDMGQDSQYDILTDKNGYVTTTMTAGIHEIGSYRYDNSGNKNYLPASVKVNVLAGTTVEEKLTLVQKDLITGKFEVREMSLDEIIAAGINPKDENNQQVYNVTVHIEYGEKQMVVNYIRNDNGILWQGGTIVPDGGNGSTGGNGDDENGGGHGGGNTDDNDYIPKFTYIRNEYNAEIITMLDLPVKTSYLKQFYDVTLYILNNASPGFKIVDCMADLEISPSTGLSVYSHTPIDTEIDGQASSIATWILRGDQGGNYDLNATFTGKLAKFTDATINATYKESVTVKDMEDTISIVVETPEHIFINPDDNSANIIVDINDPDNDKDAAVIGNQYKFKNVAYYNIGMKNISDTAIYCPSVDSGPVIVTVDEKLNENAKTELVKTFLDINGERTEVNPDEIKILNPGEMLIAYYKVYDFDVKRPSDDERKRLEELDVMGKENERTEECTEQEYVYSEMKEYFTFEPSNSEVSIDLVVNNELFYDYYFADDNPDEVVITYSTIKYGMDKTRSYDYSDDYFKGDSREYNSKLAELSLGIAAAAYSDPAYQDGYYANLSEDNLSRATNIYKAYKQLGFTDAQFKNFNLPLSTYDDKVAYSMAKKYITNSDGSQDTLVALFIRGGNYGSEWTSNFHVGSGDDHIGFANAANKVTADMHRYVASLKDQGLIKGKLKLWMTSYSRGAATTNLVAHNLNTVGIVGGVDFDIEDSYVYTFATPMGAYKPEKSDVDDSNILNIISPLDFVPMVALEKWDYGRYGITLPLPLLENVSGDFAKIEGVREHYSVSPEQWVLLNAVIKVMVPKYFPIAKTYEKSIQSSVMYAFSLINSGLDIDAIDILVNVIRYYLDNFDTSSENLYVTVSVLYTIAVVLGLLLGNLEAIIAYLADNFVKIGFDKADDIIKEEINGIIGEFVKDNVPGWSEEYEDLYYSFNFAGITNAHYPTYYMAALENCGYEHISDFNRIYKIFKGACPVDLEVYDENNKLVASVEDDKIIVNEIPVVVIGDEKFVILDDGDYRIEWTGNDEGSMDYSIQEHNASGELVRTVNFYDLPLEKGTNYNQIITSGILDKEEVYSLSSDGEKFESDYDTLLPKGESHKVTVTDGISNVEEAVVGEEVTLVANRVTESLFVKWTADDDIIFANPTSGVTSFIMPDNDVTITAVYVEDLVSEVKLDNSAIGIIIGESRKLNVTVNKTDAPLQNFVWISSDSEVVTVDNSGNVQAISVGQAKVTVIETYSGLSAECIVTVEKQPECPHDYSAVVTEPTCIVGGYTTYTCELCGEGYTSNITEPVGHKNGIATCISKAVCDICESEYGEIDVDNHAKIIIDEALEATCTIPGLTEGEHCSACDTVIREQNAVPVKDHSWVEQDRVTLLCCLCGATLNISCRHEYAPVVVKPGCITVGYTQNTCKYCNDVKVSDEVQPLGHNYNNGVCTNCGNNKTKDCSCNCHSSGMRKIIFKIILFFQKLLRKNAICECGAKHY